MRRGWPDALRSALLLSPARFLRCRKTCGLHLLGLFQSEEKLVGQSRMSALHGGRRDKLEVSPNLWAGVGLVRGGAGTALVGSGQTVAARMQEYADLGIDSFILSGYPHLEEAYRVAELVLPRLKLNHGLPQGPTRVNTGPFGETIANDYRPAARASAS